MHPLSPEIIKLMSTFAVAFSAPTFQKVLLLLSGTILAPGRRTIASALRVMGLGDEPHFGNYHRVLNRDRWSPWCLSQLLLALIVRLLLPGDQPLLLLIDETLERRRGDQIRYKSWFRDPVRSTGRFVNTVLGIRWICLAILVPLPWCRRPWALPFMSVPALSRATSQKLGKRHRSLVRWAELMVSKVRRWQPSRRLILVGDGTYAALSLTRHCQGCSPPVTFVSRLRWDAGLYDAPVPRSKFGPKPRKGERLPSPQAILTAPATRWQRLPLAWYGQQQKTVEWVSGVCLWAKRGEAPVPIRWVIVRCPQDAHFKPEAFYCSDTGAPVPQILGWVIARWNIEVTFEELRAHLGFETQRQWSARAIERTTPCLLGVFSLVVLMASVLHPHSLPLRTTSWYQKPEGTFSDALAAVRDHLWKAAHYRVSSKNQDLYLIPQEIFTALLEVACYST